MAALTATSSHAQQPLKQSAFVATFSAEGSPFAAAPISHADGGPDLFRNKPGLKNAFRALYFNFTASFCSFIH